jgi:hypothetical protein
LEEQIDVSASGANSKRQTGEAGALLLTARKNRWALCAAVTETQIIGKALTRKDL